MKNKEGSWFCKNIFFFSFFFPNQLQWLLYLHLVFHILIADSTVRLHACGWKQLSLFTLLVNNYFLIIHFVCEHFQYVIILWLCLGNQVKIWHLTTSVFFLDCKKPIGFGLAAALGWQWNTLKEADTISSLKKYPTA